MMSASSKPKVSVVIPAKNREQHLSECLNSVINQTTPPDEIIVVDDHSTDNTRNLVASFKNRGVRYEFNARKPGAQGARNHGILSAKYNWIAFQDSDDRWLLKKHEIQLKLISESPRSLKTVIHSNGTKVEPESSRYTPIVSSNFEGNCFRKLLLNSGPMFQSMLVSKQALFDIGLLDEDCLSFQEWDTAIRLSKKNQFIHIKESLFEWICHSNETISKDMRRDILGHMYVLFKHKNEIFLEYGQSGWSQAMTDLFCKSIQYKQYDLAVECHEQISNPTKLLSYFLLKHKTYLRGSGRILKISNKLVF